MRGQPLISFEIVMQREVVSADGEPPLPASFREFLALFNRGAYWESHEVLERPWRAGRSEFYKGLILLASALVHAGHGNRHGVAAQLRKAASQLAPYRPAYLGLDVDALIRHVESGQQRAADQHAADDDTWMAELTRIRLEPSRDRIRGDEPELAGED